MFTLDATDPSGLQLTFPALGVTASLSPSSAGLHVLLTNQRGEPIIEEFLSLGDINSPAYHLS